MCPPACPLQEPLSQPLRMAALAALVRTAIQASVFLTENISGHFDAARSVVGTAFGADTPVTHSATVVARRVAARCAVDCGGKRRATPLWIDASVRQPTFPGLAESTVAD